MVFSVDCRGRRRTPIKGSLTEVFCVSFCERTMGCCDLMIGGWDVKGWRGRRWGWLCIRRKASWTEQGRRRQFTGSNGGWCVLVKRKLCVCLSLSQVCVCQSMFVCCLLWWLSVCQASPSSCVCSMCISDGSIPVLWWLCYGYEICWLAVSRWKPLPPAKNCCLSVCNSSLLGWCGYLTTFFLCLTLSFFLSLSFVLSHIVMPLSKSPFPFHPSKCSILMPLSPPFSCFSR